MKSEIINEAVQEALAEDADDLLLFEERINEDLISYEQMIKRLRKDIVLDTGDIASSIPFRTKSLLSGL